MNNVLCADALITAPWDIGAVLLVQRAHEPNKGKWALPGGHIEQGESSRMAAAREVHEETGYVVSLWDCIGGFEDPFPDLGFAHLVDVWTGYLAGGRLRCSDESLNVGWFALDGLPELTPFHAKVLEEYKGRI